MSLIGFARGSNQDSDISDSNDRYSQIPAIGLSLVVSSKLLLLTVAAAARYGSDRGLVYQKAN